MSVIEAKWIECHTPFVACTLSFSVMQRLPGINGGDIRGERNETCTDVPLAIFRRSYKYLFPGN